MIRFRSWAAHNRRVIADSLTKRKTRGAKVDAPLCLGKVLVVTKLDDNFERFAALVGGDRAESFFLRAMQYAAENDGVNGSIRVPREKFGPLVLSKKWHLCSRATGETVYLALLSSGICVPIIEGGTEAKPSVLSADTSADTSTTVSADTLHLPVPLPLPVHLPPSPLPGGECSPSAPPQPPQEPHTPGEVAPVAESRPLRPRDRERFAKVLDYVIRCGAGHEQYFALAVRRRFRASQVQDAEIAEILTGTFRWVTPEKLARFLGNKPHDE